MSSSPLMKPHEAADYLAVSPRTLWELTHRRGLPCVRIGRSVRYQESDLARWIDRNRTSCEQQGGEKIT